MLKVGKSGEIELTRGDSAYLSLSIEDANGESYIPSEDDTVYMTIKRSVRDPKILIQKEYINGAIAFQPEDTKELSFGNYVYDVQLTKANGDVYTVIPPKKFIIGEEVTW